MGSAMKINFALIILCMLFMLSSCGSKSPTEPPEIIVDAGGSTVSNTSSISSWDNTVYLLDSTSEKWIDVYGEPVYYPLGTVFRVTLSEKTAAPDRVTVTDTVIRQDGSMKYDERAAVKNVSPEISENVVSFPLDAHWAAMLSSNLADYEQGAVWRCFEVTCEWGNNSCIYTFCVRTDVGMPSE